MCIKKKAFRIPLIENNKKYVKFTRDYLFRVEEKKQIDTPI